MAAYVIAEIEVRDPIGYEEYRKLAGATLPSFGGRFLVRGGRTEVLEGDAPTHRIVVIEFPGVEHARAWWGSDAYRTARAIRERTATTRLLIAEGIG